MKCAGKLANMQGVFVLDEEIDAIRGWIGRLGDGSIGLVFMNWIAWICLAGLVWPASQGWLVAGQPASEPANYVVFSENSRGGGLRTGIGQFESSAGVRVDLVGAVHIADKAYYDRLNALFKSYDAVLYELVGPSFKERARDKGQPAAGSRLQWLGALQEMMRKSLALTAQTEGIDYAAANFVHADMNTGQFFGNQAEKGESFLGLWLKALKAQTDVAAQGNRVDQPGLARILEILCSKDSATELKRLIGREFDQVEKLMAGVEGDGGTVIIGERNRVALEVLDREIAKGKKKLAIFYGAAHLPDMEQRLVKKGFRKTVTRWLTAWDLPPVASSSVER